MIPNFAAVDQTVAEICDLTVLKMVALHHLGFLEIQVFNGLCGWGVSMHN